LAGALFEEFDIKFNLAEWLDLVPNGRLNDTVSALVEDYDLSLGFMDGVL